MQKLTTTGYTLTYVNNIYTLLLNGAAVANADSTNSLYTVYNGLKVSGIPETYNSENSELFTDNGYLAVFTTSGATLLSVYYLLDTSGTSSIAHSIPNTKNNIAKNTNYESYHILFYENGKFTPVYVGKENGYYIYKADCDKLNSAYLNNGYFRFTEIQTSFIPYFRYHQSFSCSIATVTLVIDTNDFYYTISGISDSYSGTVEVW